jgi:hypothetical protein
MTATVTRGGPVAGGTVVGSTVTGRRPARRGFAFPRASSTPGKVRLIRMGLIIACLGWGALAAPMVGQHGAGLEAGIVVLALIMATGSAWGLSRRLAEYR